MTTMTTIKMASGSERMSVRCNLSEASAPVEVNYGFGGGWEQTQYQCADCRHTKAGLIRIANLLANVAFGR